MTIIRLYVIAMVLSNLRYLLTKHTEKFFFTYENFKLLIHPSVIDYEEVLNRLEDDINLMPEIEKSLDNVNIEFYRYDYNENLYSKSELLAFILASISEDWDIVKGIDHTDKFHFWLKHDSLIYDPSLALITKEDIYLENFQSLTEIKKKDIHPYLIENDNLSKFYKKEILKSVKKNKNLNFSINFINKIVKEFNKNIDKEYVLNKEKIEHIKEFFMLDDLIEL